MQLREGKAVRIRTWGFWSMRGLVLYSLLFSFTVGSAWADQLGGRQTTDTRDTRRSDSSTSNSDSVYTRNLLQKQKAAELSGFDSQIAAANERRQQILERMSALSKQHDGYVASAKTFETQFRNRLKETEGDEPVVSASDPVKKFSLNGPVNMAHVLGRALASAVSAAEPLRQPPMQDRKSEIWSSAWSYLQRGIRFDKYGEPTQTFADCKEAEAGTRPTRDAATLQQCRRSFHEGTTRKFEESFKVPPNFGQAIEGPLYGMARCFSTVQAAGATSPSARAGLPELTGNSNTDANSRFSAFIDGGQNGQNIQLNCPGGIQTGSLVRN